MPKAFAAHAEIFDMNDLDEVIHGRVRLGVLACLGDGEAHEFNALKARLRTTDGTLSVHLRKLEEAGYIAIDKGYNGRRPVTRLSMTTEGRRAFKGYLSAMSRLIDPGDE